MDKLPSSAFRRYYMKLDAPTIVTVNGHPIGTWVPVSADNATKTSVIAPTTEHPRFGYPRPAPKSGDHR